MAMTEAQKRACETYRKANIKQVLVKVNQKTEPELYAWLEENRGSSLQGYILDLIRDDMEKHRA